MTNKEAKAVIFKWLKDRDFTRIKIPGGAPYSYIHSLGDFNVMISFYKDRFDEYFIFNVGCYFDNCEYGEALIGVFDIPSNKNKAKNRQGFYYGELTEEQLIQCLNEIFDKYLKPYYEQGKKYLKKIVLNEFQFNSRYSIERDAREKINKMFGLHTTPD